MCEPSLEADVLSLVFCGFFFLSLDKWGNLNMNLALGNIKELLLMLSDKIIAFSDVKKCPLFYYL